MTTKSKSKEFKCERCGETRMFHRSHTNKKLCIACYWHTPPVHLDDIVPDKKVLFRSK